MRLIAAALVGFFGFVPIHWILARLIDPALAGAAAFAIALVGLPTAVLFLWKEKNPVEAARTRGTLQTATYSVNNAFEIAEFEDEGLHFLLGLVDGRTLFLSGQYLYEPSERGRFPSSQLIISSDTRDGWTLAVECAGVRVPVEPLPPFGTDSLAKGLPNDRELFSATPRDVAKQLGVA